MYYILAYDIAHPKRLPKMLKLCRQYLNWIQKSTFEGELTTSQFRELCSKIKSIVKREEDSVIMFEIRTEDVINKSVIGQEKNEITFFL